MKNWLKLHRVGGIIAAPPSKSVAQRMLALSLLSPGQVELRGLGFADDVLAAKRIISTLGASLQEGKSGTLFVHSPGQVQGNCQVDCGESGLALRMFAPIAALATAPVSLLARGGLSRRPMDMLKDLQHFGVRVELNGSLAPLVVTGPMHSGTVRIDGQRTSQLITGLIMALSQCQGDSCLIFEGEQLASRPYVELTLECMAQFALTAELTASQCLIPGNQKARTPASVNVEGDWSGAAFWLVAGAIAGPLTMTGLRRNSTQADTAICTALQSAGAKLDWQGDALRVSPGVLRPFQFDAIDCPDLFPPLLVLAAACPGRSQIVGVSRLAIKECDRGGSLVDMLRALGGIAGMDSGENVMWVEGGHALRKALVSSQGDHRMVMTAALLSLLSREGLLLDELSSVAKSYPDFFNVFKEMGGDL